MEKMFYMHRSKLFRFLQTLEKKELKEFELFLQSPYFNYSSNGIALYQHILKIGRLDSGKLSENSIYKSLYNNVGGEKAKQRRLKAAMTELVKAIKDFFVIKSLKADTNLQKTILYKNLNDRSIETEFNKPFDKDLLSMEDQDPKNEATYWYLLQLHLAKHYHLESLGTRQIEPNLNKVFLSLDHYYVLKKLKYTIKGKYIESIFNDKHNYQYPFLDTIIQAIEQSNLSDWPLLVQMYYHAYIALFKTGEEAQLAYEKLKLLLLNKVLKIDKHEARGLFLMACNYQVAKLNRIWKKGSSKEIKNKILLELKELYEFQLNEDISIFDFSSFMNIMQVYMALNQLDKALELLNANKNKIDELTFLLCSVEIMFEQKEFKEIIERIDITKFKDVDLNAKARIVLLKANYELWVNESLQAILEEHQDEDDYITNAIRNVHVFVERKDKSHHPIKGHREFYANLCKLLEKLRKIHFELPENKATKLQELLIEIKETPKVYYKPWIRAKVKEAIKKLERKTA